jgi:hypothetical protein
LHSSWTCSWAPVCKPLLIMRLCWLGPPKSILAAIAELGIGSEFCVSQSRWGYFYLFLWCLLVFV